MRKIISLNKGWFFEKKNHVPSTWPGDHESIDLPHTWNNLDGQDGGGDYWRGKATYTRKLEIVKKPDEAYILEIRGCGNSADVCINNIHIAHHDGGYSTFRVDMTEALAGGENLLSVVADNSENESVYPQAADFTFYGGLYRDVNLIIVPKRHFELIQDGTPGIRVTPVCKGRDYEVRVDTWQNGGRVKIAVDGQEKFADSHDGCASTDFLLRNAHLWDGIDDPYLYEARAQLLDEDGAILDEIYVNFGCRTFDIDPQKGFFLNGRPYPLRGVSRHQDRSGVGNALTRQMHEEDFSLIREMGANSIRLAHYQHDQYFYDLCDRHGMITWAEIPYISAHMEQGRENTISQMKELIAQNYNHASIVVWGLSNEITMQGMPAGLLDNHIELKELVHRMDSTRPTVMAHVSMLDIDDPIVRFPDAAAYNVYYGWYSGELSDNEKFFDGFHEKYPDMPIGFSEYGCDTNPAYHTNKPERGDYTEEYQRVYHEHILHMINERPWLWCTYAWNMFDFAADARDEGGTPGVNQKGIVTMDRKLKKDVYYLYKAFWSKEPFVYLCGRRYVDRTEDVTDITVYTNLGEIELYVNGTLFDKKQGGHVIRFELPISEECRVEARSGSFSDAISIRHVDEANPDYKLKGGGILNWFDADGLKQDYYCIEDKVSEMMQSPEAVKTIMRCVNTQGKDESDFIKELRANPERLNSLDMSFNEMLDRCGGIESNIKRHINAALQRVKRI